MTNKIKFIFAALLVCFAAFAGNAKAQIADKQTKPVLLVLGTYHMGNPGRDLSNVAADDVRAAKRQREIAEFIAALKLFKPTRVAVEIPPVRAAAYLGHYQEYLNGNYALAANEVDQIGFRLAREMNHKQLYSIDWQGNFDFDKVLASAKANNQIAVTDGASKTFKGFADKYDRMLKTATITEILRSMNRQSEVDELHRAYLATIRVGGGEGDYAGADLARDWYERNLKIYANILRLNESKNDRILVIIGASHVKLLQQFAADSGDFEVEKLDKYL